MDIKINQIIKLVKGRIENEDIANYFLSLAYLKYGTNDKLIVYANKIISNLHPEIKNELNSFINTNITLKDDAINLFFELKNKFNKYNEIRCKNKQIYNLIARLLDIKDGETIYELGSGVGDFLLSTNEAVQFKNVKYASDEINYDSFILSKFVFDLKNIDNNIENNDAIENNLSNTFNKGFVFPSISENYINKRYEKHINQIYADKNIKVTGEWLFVYKLLENVSKDGKVIALLPKRPLYNDISRQYRNYLLVNDFSLEAIIKLKADNIINISNEMYLLVFSNNNKNVKVIDCDDYLNNDILDIDSILRDYNKNTLDKEFILSKNTYDLNILTKEKINILNAKKLHEIATIKQGSQYTLLNFKDKIKDEATNYRLLTSSDIEDGNINYSSLKYFKPTDDKILKHKVEKDDIIITSKSPKIKIATVDKSVSDNIIVLGGMFIIRVNKNIMNPLFLKAFLESDKGQTVLKSIQKGAKIPIITRRDLMNIEISCPDINTQNEFCETYISNINEYKDLKTKINNIQKKISDHINSI